MSCGELLYKNLQNKDNLDKYVDAEEEIFVESFKTSPQHLILNLKIPFLLIKL